MLPARAVGGFHLQHPIAMGHHFSTAHGGVPTRTRGLDPSLQRILREDEHATPEVAHRQLLGEVVDLLRSRHTLGPHPELPERSVVLDGNLRRVRTVPSDIAHEAAAAYQRERVAVDPAALPIERGGDGRQVDLHALCRELGLPSALAENGYGEVLLTADMAQAILVRNTDNRPMRKDAVARFVRLMDEGRWKLTTDAIGIDAHGRVVNGQHRLEALTQTCEPQPFLVKLNVDPGAFTVIDSGRPRSPSDALYVAGLTHRYVRAAVVRFVIHASRGRLWTAVQRVEADEVLEQAQEMEPRLTECIREAKMYEGRSRQLVRASHAAFLLWMYGEDHGDAIQVYLERLAKGFGIEEGQPAGTVRNALVANLHAYPKLPGLGILALMIRGAEAHVAGEEMASARAQGARAWPSPSVARWPAQAVPTAKRKQVVGRA